MTRNLEVHCLAACMRNIYHDQTDHRSFEGVNEIAVHLLSRGCAVPLLRSPFGGSEGLTLDR